MPASQFSRLGLRLALLSSTMIVATLPAVARAQSETAQSARTQAGQVRFNVPPQELDSALTSVADQGGIRIFFTSAELRGVRSNGVSGTMAVEQALSQALTGTGFSWRYQQDRTVVIERVPQSQGGIQLGPVRVEGSGSLGTEAGAQTDVARSTSLPAPYAGGQVARGSRVGLLGNQDVFDTPFSVTSYTETLLRDQQARTIVDALRNEPSIRNITNPSGPEDQFQIRGFRYFQAAILFDGLSGIGAFRSPAIENAERIEILKGPNAFAFGVPVSPTVGGTINIVPKRATDDPVTRFIGSYANRSEFAARVDIGRRFGGSNEWGVRLNASHRDGENYLKDSAIRHSFASAAVDYRGDAVRASVDLFYVSNATRGADSIYSFAAGFQIPAAPPSDLSLGLGWKGSRNETVSAVGRVEIDVTDAILTYAAFGISHAKDDRDGVGYFVTAANGDATGFGGFPDRFRDRNRSGEVGVRADFATGPIRHRLNLAASGVWQDRRYSFSGGGLEFASNIYNPVFVAYQKFSPGASADFPASFSGFAASDTIHMFDDRLQVTAGARYQRVKTPPYDRSRITPAIAVLVKPTAGLSLYGNYVEALQQAPTAPQGAINAGEVFDPIKTRQIEGGIKYDAGNFGVTLGAFSIEMPSGITNPATRIFAVDGIQRNRGIEISVFGEPVAGTRLLGGALILDGKLVRTADNNGDGRGDFDGNTAPGAARLFLNASLEHDIRALPGLTATARLTHTTRQFISPSNLQSIPSWTTMDFGVRYTFDVADRPWTIRANVENAFDRDYWQSAIAGFTSRGAARTFLLSVEANF